jgi:hypothetical protein
MNLVLMCYSFARFVWGAKAATFLTITCVGLVVPKYADHLWRCQSVELSVDDLRTGRGVVLGRAVPMLRSVETQPLTGGFVLLVGRILHVKRRIGPDFFRLAAIFQPISYISR